jgi:hypothetical protein
MSCGGREKNGSNGYNPGERLNSSLYAKSDLYYQRPPLQMTNLNDSFRMTSLKAGKYLIKEWHKSLKPIEREIDILPGQNFNLPLKLEKSEEDK